jgi:hypothetical protein
VQHEPAEFTTAAADVHVADRPADDHLASSAAPRRHGRIEEVATGALR